MPEFWKTKFYVSLFLALISFYLLLPTFLDLKNLREEAKASGADLPWYASVLPDNVINLGLDLQGGLYLELEVGVAQALDHQFGFLVSDLRRYVLKDDLAEGQVTELGQGFVRIELSKDKWGTLQSRLQDVFGNKIFESVSETPELFFEIHSDLTQARKKGLEALQGLENFQGDFFPLKDGKVLAIPFFGEKQRQDFLRVLTTEEMKKDFLLTEAPSVLHFQISGDYQNQLKKDIVEQAAKAVRNRIDRFGVVEASVSRQSGDRLVVELPGIKNPDSIINIIRKTGKLEFRLVNDSVTLPRVEQLLSEKSKELNIATPYEEEGLTKLNQVLKAEFPEGTEIAYSLERDPVTKKVLSAEPYLLEDKAHVTGDMLDNAKVETQNNLPYVSMSFNKTGTKSFGDITSQNVGKRLAILLDGVVMSAPVIKSAILGGEAQIELGFGRYDELRREATDLVLILREGALPASLNVATKNLIGPSLGQESIDAGVKSILISAIGVLIFMILYYRAAGIIANLALLLNVVFIFAILCVFQASLTLPGMAGIVLTLGMAVDANVIIFERMREEKALGHSLKQIIDNGYAHAKSAIIDGNITTFIAGLVLFEFGTGPIKGFATTLMVGIVTTLFTAIVLTRLVYDGLVGTEKMKTIGF